MHTEQKGFIWPIVVVIIALIFIGGGIYYFYTMQGESSLVTVPAVVKTGDGPVVNDTDLRVALDTGPVDCTVIKNMIIPTVDEQRTLVDYVTATTTVKASAALQTTIKKYANTITFYITGGAWAVTAAKSDVVGTLCNLGVIRTVATLTLAQIKMMVLNKDTTHPPVVLAGLLSTTQQVEDSNQAVIAYLVTQNIKNQTIDLLSVLKSKKLIKPAVYQPILATYLDNKVGQKRGLQYEYAGIAQGLDDIAASKYTTQQARNLLGEPADITAFQKARTDFTFQPNNTKALFYTLLKTQYTNVDLPCGTTYTTVLPSADLIKDTTTENYLGKVMFVRNNGGTLDRINVERCSFETKVKQF